MSHKFVKITCACRVKRCAVCSKCSRCECGHDGLSVETKMARGRGGKQPSASAKRSSTTKTLDYVEASHSEDDYPPLCSTPLIPTRKKPRNGRTVPSSSSSTGTRSRAPSSATSTRIRVAPSSATSSRGDPRGAILKLTPSMSASKSIQLIRDFFGLSYTATSNFPSEEDRHEAESFDALKKGTRVVLFLVSTLQKMCALIFPQDSEGCMRAVAQYILQTTGDSAFKTSAMAAQEALPEKSIQRKVLLAVLCDNMIFPKAKEKLSVGRKAFDTARPHYRCLLSGSEIRSTV